MFFCSAILCVVALAPGDNPVLPPPRHGVYVVAHRGAHENAPENTLAAYRKAIELGCDFVEIDVRTTKDGRFVSMHNATVDAYCTDGTVGKVRDFTLAQLKALDIGSRIGPQWKDERVPTFEEILDLCQDEIGVYLDLKDADVAPLIERIRARGMERNVIWYAGPAKLREVAAQCPECIPMPDPGPEKRLAKVIEEFKPRVIASVWDQYSASFVEACHKAGAIVIVDESDPSCWEQAVAWKSDGIQTDHPEDLIAWLKKRSSAP